MLVRGEKQSEVERIAVEVFSETAVGDPMDAGSFVGPLVSKAQQERVQGYIRKGVDEGARLVAGGDTPPAGHERGSFVRPTLLAAGEPDMTIDQEESFRPL